MRENLSQDFVRELFDYDPDYSQGEQIDHKDTVRNNNSWTNLRLTNAAGQWDNPITKAKISESQMGNDKTKGRVWVTDGTSNRMIKLEEDEPLPSGWRAGQTRSIGRSLLNSHPGHHALCFLPFF